MKPSKMRNLISFWTSILRTPFLWTVGIWTRLQAQTRRGSRQRLDIILHHARALSDADRDESNLSFWAADAVMEPNNDLPELISTRARFMRRVHTNSARQSSWKRWVNRAEDMNANHTIDHFLMVSGHSLHELEVGLGHLARSQALNQTVAGVEKPSTSLVSMEAFRSLGLSAFNSVRSSQLRKTGSRIVATAVSAYLVLVIVGSWQQGSNRVGTIGSIPEYSWLELGSTPRGRYIPREFYVTRRYKVALNKLVRANTSILGYIPGFRQDLLNEGILELEDAIDFQAEGGYVYPQALIMLADAYIRAGQTEKAIPLVDEVVARNERKAKEARALRAKLRKQGWY